MSSSSLYTDDYQKLANKIKMLRIKINLTQQELAIRLNKTQSYISKIETCQLKIEAMELKKIANALNVEIKDLL